jgi:hypothetical protein
MTDLFRLIFWTLVDLMRARATLEAEIWVLRQQINVLRRAAPRRQSFGIFDRLIFVGLYRLFPKACDALAIVKPDTIIRWHRAGFRAYWRWKSRHCGGRPTVPLEIRKLICEMSIANPLWGAPRLHGELLTRSASKSGRRMWQSIWSRDESHCARKAVAWHRHKNRHQARNRRRRRDHQARGASLSVPFLNRSQGQLN